MPGFLLHNYFKFVSFLIFSNTFQALNVRYSIKNKNVKFREETE